ncbi:HAD family hydrolase [Spiroplasma endosymbiont of Amphibalanus improvisus]|uniref:HAD family hydrolase n=1 Tax=Spiroplasma endosymbiont of Amphibalanus improvisus TaxID=3066327 RepID=UPI00313ACB2F
MKYRLIVSDLDGTLASTKSISKVNIDAIKRAYNQGVNLWIATGRSPKNTKPIIDKLSFLGKDLKVICFNGAIAFSPFEKEIYHNVFFDSSIVEKIFHELNDLQLSAWSYVVNNLDEDKFGLTTNKKGMTTRFLAKHNNSKGVIYNNEKHKELSSYKFIVSGKHHKIEEFKNRLQQQNIKCTFYGSSYVGINKYRSCIEVSPENVNKTTPLKLLITKAKISEKEIVSIGDGSNDVELLQFAGLGVAMGNARKIAKNAADTSTSSFSKNGFAKIINQVILNK